jgi:hypothetical protein
MKFVKASEFKSEFAGLVEGTAVGGEALIVVKSGKTRVRLKTVRKRAYRGMDRGKIQILGDIVSPMWDLWGEDYK